MERHLHHLVSLRFTCLWYIIMHMFIDGIGLIKLKGYGDTLEFLNSNSR